jgi:Protein of unknown function (DUF3093)
VPWWWWLVGAGFVLGVFIVYLVWTPLPLALIVGIVLLALLVVGMYTYGNVRVRVEEQGLRAGRAVLPATSIDDVRTVDAQERRRLLGPKADARAYTLVRGYIPGGVYVHIKGADDDGTPYWFVSSRHPEALAAALTGVTTTPR